MWKYDLGTPSTTVGAGSWPLGTKADEHSLEFGHHGHVANIERISKIVAGTSVGMFAKEKNHEPKCKNGSWWLPGAIMLGHRMVRPKMKGCWGPSRNPGGRLVLWIARIERMRFM